MSDVRVLSINELPLGAKKVVKAGETEILLIHQQDGLIAVQSKCPHAGAPLEQAAICNGRLVCPWHHGTFALPSGDLLEPPAMESLKTFSVRLSGQDIFVNPEPRSPLTAPARQVSEGPVFLLVGAGAAAAMAASTLHQTGFSARIIAVDPVAEEPVDRTQLSKDALSAKIPLDEIGFDTLSVVGAECVTASVTKLSAATQEAHLSNGRVVKFDKALVATGGHPKRLEIPGAELA
jgi:nitrite reductase/ring-hydroxylating ferredoxin subunit